MLQRRLFLKDGKLIEEDMTKYEKIYYHFLFSDLKHAQHVLLQENVQAVLTKKSLRIQLEHHTIQDLINIFHSHKINIVDIQKEVIGSEKDMKKYLMYVVIRHENISIRT